MEQNIRNNKEESVNSFLYKNNLEKRKLEYEELKRKIVSASLQEDKEIDVILDKISYDKENEQKMMKLNQMKEAKRKQLIFRKYATKVAIYMSSLIIGASSIVLIKKLSDEISQPVNIVATDMMANSKLLEVDGKYIDAKEFDVTDTDKLYKYIIENNIGKDEIYSAIAEKCKIEFIDYEFAITRLNERYPEIFEKALEQEEKNKTR